MTFRSTSDGGRFGRVLVTGAAGAIGTATMQALCSAGACAIGFDRALPEPMPSWPLHNVDVSIDEQLEAGIERLRASGPLSHLITIAGGALPGEPTTQHDPTLVDVELFRASLDHNLVTAFRVIRACLPWLRDDPSRDRSIILTSSFNALSAQGMPGYSAAKAGLIGLMHALVEPLGREGIRINVVAPGTVSTPRTRRLWSVSDGHFDRLQRSTALGRLGEPEDVAEAYLAQLRMRHVTGQVAIVDGGQCTVHR